MIKKGNFSSNNVPELFAMGEEAFKDAYKGKVNCDLNELWAEIIKQSEGETKAHQTKPEGPKKTK